MTLWTFVVNDPLARVELFLCQSLATFFVDHKLDALGRSRSSWRPSIPLTHTRMEAYFAECKHYSCSSTDWWSNLQCFLVSSSCTGTSRNKNIFSCPDATNSTSTLSGMTCVSAPVKPTQAAQQDSSQPRAKVHTFEKKKKNLESDLFVLRSKGRPNTLAKKKENHYCVVFFVRRRCQLPAVRQFQVHARNAKGLQCNFIATPRANTAVDPQQAATRIRPHVSGVPTGPTCQQGIGVLVLWPSTSSCQNPNPLLTSTTHSSHVCPWPQRRLLVRLISTASGK